MAPIALGVSDASGLDRALVLGAVIGGATFGDNLSVISDTAIVASRTLGCTMREKFRENLKLALPAALLTLVGYSVSDTIVVFDRIREVRGKNPSLTPQMINDSVNQTLSRTILTSMTVFLVSFVLYAFGGEGVHLFAFVMVVGVIVGTYSSIYIASPLLLMFGEGGKARTTEPSRSVQPAAAQA